MRQWSRVVAVILLIAAARGLPHFAQDDPGCGPGSLQVSDPADAPGHAIGEAQRLDHQNHCALCHWSRSLRSPLTSLSLWIADVPPPILVARRPASAPVAVVVPELPARAPPSVLA